MLRIGIRELRQHASRYIRRAQNGERLEITDRGRTVAMLGPPVANHWRDLVETGHVIPATGNLADAEPRDWGIGASARLAAARASER